MRVWQHGATLQPCKCPICRRSITLIIPSEASSGYQNDPEVGEVLGNVERYNRQFGGGHRSLVQVKIDMYMIIPILFG